MAPKGHWRSFPQNLTDENGEAHVAAALHREHQHLQRQLAQMRKVCLEAFEQLRVLHQVTLELEAERERLLSELRPHINDRVSEAGVLSSDMLLDLLWRGDGTVLVPMPRFLQRQATMQQHAGPSGGQSNVHQSRQDSPQRFEAPSTMPPMPRFLGVRLRPGLAPPPPAPAPPPRARPMMATAMPRMGRSMAAPSQAGPFGRQRPWREAVPYGEAGAFRTQRQWGAAMVAEARDRNRVSHGRQRHHRQRPVASTTNFGEAMRTMAAMVQQLPTAAVAA
mmetsp:Transcript_136147/g.264821  ORF Transcript_136147/g.264821 Transcript_136147/m.264821 type:complete len:278 (-) Transcript_136147:137-970(-)